MVEDIVPAIINSATEIVGMCWTSDKAAQKTLEQKSLWHVHAKTTRVIEASPSIAIDSVLKKQGWYLCTVPQTQKVNEAQLAGLANLALFSALRTEAPSKKSNTGHEGESNTKSDSSSSGFSKGYSNGDGYAILATLHALIQERKHKIPEGSYTSHLFTSGKDKIRKKVGEEAIETILSSTRDSTIAESADLLFHLFVMLVNEGIDPQKVMQELAKRHINA